MKNSTVCGLDYTNENEKPSEKSALQEFLVYCLPYMFVTLFGILILVFHLYHVFRTILFVYLTDFVLVPVVSFSLVFANILRRHRRCRQPFHSWSLSQMKYLVKRSEIGIICVSLLMLSIFVYASVIEPFRLRIEQIDIMSEKVSTPVTLLHISDIQAASIGRYEQQVFREIERLQPDMIVHTGDLLQPYFYKDLSEELLKLTQLFRRLQPPLGIYNVVGNVDWRVNPQEFDHRAGVITLIDRHQRITSDKRNFSLLGLSIASSQGANPASIRQWMQTVCPHDFTLLLGHTPNYVLKVRDLPIDLCLAGHTHGGQVRLPFIGPLLTFSHTPRAWALGYRKIQNLHLNVSAGIGAEHASQLPAIRFNCPPAMTLFTIQPLSGGEKS